MGEMQRYPASEWSSKDDSKNKAKPVCKESTAFQHKTFIPSGLAVVVSWFYLAEPGPGRPTSIEETIIKNYTIVF